VKRSTLNFQRGDRKGSRRAGYGDRHDVRYADQERSTSYAQLSTFNGVTEGAQRGRDMGTDTEFGRLDAAGLVKPDGLGRQLRFHLGNKADIEVANGFRKKAQFC